MAVQVSGTQVSWGIPSAGKTVADSLVTGIVQDFEISTDGNVTEITDEDGDIVSRVDHGEKNTVTFSTLVTAASPTLPAKGDEVTFAAAIDGVALNTGEAYVESASIAYAGTSTTTVSITVSHYPSMTTPA
jgi:phytoene dehydrogenase-like protein